MAEGRAALRRGDWATARRAFDEAIAAEPTGAALEGSARASYLALDFGPALAGWEHAYALYRGSRQWTGAARVARLIGYMYFAVAGDRAVAAGWIARSQRLQSESGETSERGWVALNVGMFEGDRTRKEDSFREAIEAARRFGDVDLELVSLAYLGASMVHGDCIEEGMVLLDEALAAVSGDESDDFEVLEEIFCQLFSACEYAHDVRRADEWIRVGMAIAERRSLPAVGAFCRTHYGGVLTAAGRWPEADEALTEAVRLWGMGQRSILRRGALARLADLRVRQGRFEEAAQLLDGIDVEEEPVAARPLSALHMARGETVRARDVIDRALGMLDSSSTAAGPLLAMLVDLELADGAVEAAATTAERLATGAALHSSPYLRAIAALARARVCAAAGTGDPRTCLREALAGFNDAQMPVEVAHSRLELAMALLPDQPEVAMAEARAALDAFERLHVARQVDAAAAVLRSLGARPASPGRSGNLLTKREAEVLDLLGLGLSNPEISDRLFISRKTVEHHVGNVLAKLGLRSRAEAAAYAARTKSGVE